MRSGGPPSARGLDVADPLVLVMVAVSDGLASEPKAPFFPAGVAGNPELLLPNRRFPKFFSFESWNRLSTEAEAHREDSGRKMTTAVMTSDDMAGLSTTY